MDKTAATLKPTDHLRKPHTKAPNCDGLLSLAGASGGDLRFMGDRAGVACAVKQNADYKKYHPGVNQVAGVETKSIHG
jgi:hypothetical protein